MLQGNYQEERIIKWVRCGVMRGGWFDDRGVV